LFPYTTLFRSEAVRLSDDDLRVLAQRGCVQLALEKLRRAAQSAEGIFDLVRQLFDHEPAAIEARQQIGLARDAAPLRGVGQLEQQMGSGDLPLEGRDRHIQRARIPRGAERPEAELAVRESFTRIE